MTEIVYFESDNIDKDPNSNESDDKESDDNKSDDNESDDNESDDNESDDNESDDNESDDNESDDNESDDNESDDKESDDKISLLSGFNQTSEYFERVENTIDNQLDICYENNTDYAEIDCGNNLALPERLKNFDFLTSLEILNGINLSLDYLPQYLIELNIYNSDIPHVDGFIFPKTLVKLTIKKSNVITITNLHDNIEELNLCGNMLTHIQKYSIPTFCKILKLQCNKKLKIIDIKSNNINYLDISDTSITNFEYLCDTIKVLKSNKCSINIISTLPIELETWISFNSNIKNILCEFPKNLKNIDLYGNYLKQIPSLPSNIKKCDLENNKLIHIPEFPNDIEELKLMDNENLNKDDLQKYYDHPGIFYDNKNPSIITMDPNINFFSNYNNNHINKLRSAPYEKVYNITNPYYIVPKVEYIV
jgi:hypothetical protein